MTMQEESKDVNSERSGYFASGSVSYTEETLGKLFETISKPKKISFFAGIAISIIATIVSILDVGLNTYIILPIFAIIIFVLFIITLKKNVKISVEQNLKLTPNAVTSYWFYDDHFECETRSDNSFITFNKEYSDVTKTFITDEYLYILFDGRVIPIDRKSLPTNEYDILIKILNISINKNKANKKELTNKSVGTLLLVFLILSIVSIPLGAIIEVVLSSTSPYPLNVFTFFEYSWILLLMLPLPLASIILGFVFYKKNNKRKRNIIVGIIACLLLLFDGIVYLMPDFKVNHDLDYLNEVETKVKIVISDAEAISTYKEDRRIYSNVKIIDNEDMLYEIYTSGKWTTTQTEIMKSAVPKYDIFTTSDYDYYLFYDADCNFYNECMDSHKHHQYYYFAYHSKSKSLLIINGNLYD